MNKNIICILIILLLNYCNAATLEEQLDTVKLLLEKCDVNNNLNTSRFDDLCTYDPYVICGEGSVTELMFTFGGECTINDEVSILNNLRVFQSDSGIKITDIFFTSISNFIYLYKINIQNIVSYPSSNDFKLPTRLNDVTINTNLQTVITSVFNQPNIQQIEITSTNYIQPALTKPNYYLKNLKLNINSNAILQNGIGQYLTSVSGLNLNFNGPTSAIIPSSYLKDLEAPKLLLSGNITFDNGLQYYFYYYNGYNFVYMNNVVLGKCSVSPCHKFPLNTEINNQDSDVYFNDFDFTNIQVFKTNLTGDKSVSIVNQLPTINNPSNLQLSITNYNDYVIGDIPDNYCNLASVNLQNNGLNGYIPSCFKCSSSAKQMILPNKFKDFDESSPTECPNFSIDNQDQIYVATGRGSMGYITVTGKDLGWEFKTSSGTYSASPIPNKEIKIPVPALGKSSSIPIPGQSDNTVQVQFQNSITITLKYAYAPPVIESYDISVNKLIFNGNNFDLSNPNLVTLGEYVLDFKGESYAYTQQLTHPNISVFALKEGSKYKVSVVSDHQVSNTFEFYYIKSINFPNDKYQLSMSGGQVEIKSTYSYIPRENSVIKCKVTPSKSTISKDCIVNSITNVTTLITYPKTNKEDYATITLDVGGRIFELRAEYYKPEGYSSSSGSSSSDDNSTSSSKSTSSSNDSDDDSVSISTSNLNNINFIILISLLIITIISTISTSSISTTRIN